MVLCIQELLVNVLLLTEITIFVALKMDFKLWSIISKK